MTYQLTVHFYSPQPTSVLAALLQAKYAAQQVAGTFFLVPALGAGEPDYHLCMFERDAAADRDRVYARLDPVTPVTTRRLALAAGRQLFEELVAGEDDIRLRPLADALLHGYFERVDVDLLR